MDKPYPGSGANEACALKHPYFLFSSDKQYGEAPKWIIAGGDTVIIKNGQYGLGYKGPGAHDQWQFCPGDPYDCHMPPLPSGTSEHPTKLLGENHGHCASKPVLVGQYGVDRVLDLSGSSYVDLECLEITDHESCARIGNGNTCRSDYP
ncbi:MAG TPA: hypothetical protein VKX46_17155, partial [Ktedonobacteraceae bacterium]|nr:hypothetical protein [Ktedonobacteraceae bacterium]